MADPAPLRWRGHARRTSTAIVTAVALTILTACTGGGTTGTVDAHGDGFADDGCTHVVVATSSEKVNMLDALATAFKDSPEHKNLKTCATIRPVNVSSGNAARYL